MTSPDEGGNRLEEHELSVDLYQSLNEVKSHIVFALMEATMYPARTSRQEIYHALLMNLYFITKDIPEEKTRCPLLLDSSI